MLGLLEYLLIGIFVGCISGYCIVMSWIIIKHYIDLKNHKTDVENITKNILNIIDEESGSNVDYMTARPIV